MSFSERFVDSTRSIRSHIPEDWNSTSASLWQTRISDGPNVCRTAATLTAYCAGSALNWTLNQDGACFWNSSRSTQHEMEASGQLHPLATLTPRKVAPIPIGRKLGGPQNRSEISCLCQVVIEIRPTSGPSSLQSRHYADSATSQYLTDVSRSSQ